MALLAAFAVGLVYYVVWRTPTGHITTMAAKTRPISVITPVKAQDYDPEGNGAERPTEVPLAFDSTPGTAWYTEGYVTEKFGNLKSGLGIYADFAKVRSVSSVNIKSVSPGWNMQLKGSNDGKSWRVITERSSMKVDETFSIKASYRYYLVWITKLTKTPGRGNYRVGIDEITFKG